MIRGNASEIMALAGAAGTTRGVDSTVESEEALVMGKQLSLDLGTVVAISGREDYVRPPPYLTGMSNQGDSSCNMPPCCRTLQQAQAHAPSLARVLSFACSKILIAVCSAAMLLHGRCHTIQRC